MANSEYEPSPPAARPPVVVWVLAALALLVISGVAGYFAFAPEEEGPPPGVVGDPFLMEGRGLFLSRCAVCHGASGGGDGPLSYGFAGATAGDLTAAKLKHGDRAEDVLRVIRVGVPGTRMASWGALLEDSQMRAVAAYCFALARRPVPEELRSGEPR